PSSVPAFVPALRSMVRPEPTEHARYLIAIAAPVALAGLLTWLVARSRAPPRTARIDLLVHASQLLLAGFLVAAVLGQHAITYRSEAREPGFRHVYFTWPALAFAAAAAAVAAALLRRGELIERVARRWRDTPRRTLAARAVAVA